MAKFDYEASVYGNAAECLAQIPLVNSASMNLVWPPSAEDDMNPSLAGLPAVTKLIQETLCRSDCDMSIFDEVRAIPNFEVF
ncbi:hypothetical protein F4825DRAFT_438524 [Nemania diffusa]|nr:hypothetical protein F4825DRAFT_438524 [Nemania diffusa]